MRHIQLQKIVFFEFSVKKFDFCEQKNPYFMIRKNQCDNMTKDTQKTMKKLITKFGMRTPTNLFFGV